MSSGPPRGPCPMFTTTRAFSGFAVDDVARARAGNVLAVLEEPEG